jgi:hypothetical protein
MPKVATKNRIADNGETTEKKVTRLPSRECNIPVLEKRSISLKLRGDRPLMMCNKMNIAEDIANAYGDPDKKKPLERLSDDEMYKRAFYVMPSSKFEAPSPKALYGIVASGIKKCFDAGIRTTGINDNTRVGNISKAFHIMAEEGGLCRIHFKKLVRDIRPVNIGSGQKTVPQMRHRPMFLDWYCDVKIIYNPKVIGPNEIVNLGMHAGQYIGWGELRAQKKMGECGGFIIEEVK